MNKFLIPSFYEWTNNCLCSTGDGILYMYKKSFNHIGALNNPNEFPVVKHFWNSMYIAAICVDPEWEESHNFAVINEDGSVFIWNIDKGDTTRGHKCHIDYPSASQSRKQNSVFAICWTESDKILSTENSTLAVYCTVSNRYTVYQKFFNKNFPKVLKPCQFDKDLVAAGCQNGSVTIFSLNTMQTLHHVNLHEKEVTSLDWLNIAINVNDEKRKIIKARPKNRTKMPELCDEPFDIYAFDENEVEFGTIIDKRPSEHFLKKEGTQSYHEDFNFLEECQNLKENILGNDQIECSETVFEDSDRAPQTDEPKTPSLEELSLNDAAALNLESPRSSPAHSDKVDGEDHKLKDFIVINKEIVREAVEESRTRLVLVSGGKDYKIWFYNVVDGAPLNNFKPSKDRTDRGSNDHAAVSVLITKTNKLMICTQIGNLIEYSMKLEESNSKLSMKTDQIRVFPVSRVITFCQLNNGNIWCFKKGVEMICMNTLEEMEVICHTESFGTAQVLLENPLDPNIIAIGCYERKIAILNLSSWSPRKALSKIHSPKIKSKITCLAWHPEKENILAFGSEEGRVGIVDTLRNQILLMDPHVFHEVYCIQWMKINGKHALACVSKDRSFYYAINNWDKSEAFSLPALNFPAHIHVPSDNDQYLVYGNLSGSIFVLDLNDKLKVLYTLLNLFPKYICALDYKDNILAVGAVNSIKLVDLSRFDGWENNENVSALGSHDRHITSLRWAKGNSKKLVSSGFDHAIKVWDTEKMTCISVYYSTGAVTSAIFSPLNDHMIIAVGKDITILCYDYTEYSADTKLPKPKKRTIKWATMEITNEKGGKKKKEIKPKIEDTPPEQVLIDDLKNLTLESIEKPTAYKTDAPTVFVLSAREMNNSDLVHQNILDIINGAGESLNSKLFGDSNAVTEFINAEQRQHMESRSKSIAHVFIPQIQNKFKEEVLERIADKSLTDYHVALAPHISYEFWQNCCEAYANQCLEKGETLTAITYLLSIHMVDEAIDFLCKNNFYKEAWTICKLRKDEADPIFGVIVTQWTTYLEDCGNFEAAATIWAGVKNYQKAIEVLTKRREPTESILETIEELKKHISE